MNTDGKPRPYIQDIVERLIRDYQPERIIPFGSFAYGQPNRDSDIDMLIVKDTDESLIDRMVRVREIEKYLKGYLLSTGWSLRRIHDLEELLRTATLHDAQFGHFLPAIRRITSYYFVDRYPLTVAHNITESELTQSLADAHKLIALIREKLELA